MNTVDFRQMFINMVENSCNVGLVAAGTTTFKLFPGMFERPEKAQSWIDEPREDAWFITVSNYVSVTIGVVTFSPRHNPQGGYICTWTYEGGGNHDQSVGEMRRTILSAQEQAMRMDGLNSFGNYYNRMRKQEEALKNGEKSRWELRDVLDAKEDLRAQLAQSELTFPSRIHAEIAGPDVIALAGSAYSEAGWTAKEHEEAKRCNEGVDALAECREADRRCMAATGGTSCV